MRHIAALGYVGLSVSDIAAWTTFACGNLGLQAVPRDDGAVDLRMDSYASRLRLIPEGRDDIAYVGWEVADRAALDGLSERLAAAEYPSSGPAGRRPRRVMCAS